MENHRSHGLITDIPYNNSYAIFYPFLLTKVAYRYNSLVANKAKKILKHQP